MDRKRKIFIGKTVAILSVIPVLMYALSAGPDPGKAGVPGESTCAEAGCHVGTPLNGGGGSVTIDAGGTTYTPGVKQRISVTVSDPAQRRWGFQLTPRIASSPKITATKLPAGNLASIDSNTQVLCATANLIEVPCNTNSVEVHIEHTTIGSTPTAVGAGKTFQFDWTPPATDVGPITLYAAGNAANNNTIETGDHIYTTSVTLSAGSSGGGGDKPSITSVVNGASFVPGSSIAGYSWVSILGSGLGTSSSRTWKASDFNGSKLPMSLDGTSVTINNKPAYVQYVSPTLVNVLSPVDTARGPVNVQVTYNGVTGDPMGTTMAAVAPAFFIFNNDKYIAALHANSTLLGPASLYPGLSTPAKPGETIELFGSGFGPTTPAIPDGTLLTGSAKTTNTVTVTIGGVTVTPTFAGLVATGEYQINVTIPTSTPNGDTPVIATVNGVSSPAKAFVNVQQ